MKRIASVVGLILLATVILVAQASKITSSGTLPTNCGNGNIYQKTGASKGLYWCDAGTWVLTAAGAGVGTVTNTGTLTGGKLIQGNGTTDITVNTTTATVTKLTSGTPSAATDGTDYLSPATGWTKLAQIVTSGSQATVDFTSISAAYSALEILWFSRDTQAGTGSPAIRVRLNNDSTAADYTATSRIGSQNGSAFASTQASSTLGAAVGNHPQNGNSAGIVGGGRITLVGYADTTFHKRIVAYSGTDDGSNNGTVYTATARWGSTSAVNRVTVTTDGTAFTNGSVFTLYGIP